MHLRRQQSGDHGDGDEESEEEEGDPDITVREQHRHRHDRPELTDGTHRQDRRPDRRPQYSGVVQDGQERAERRRRQAEGDNDGVEHETGGMEEDADAKREHQGGSPRARRPAEMALAHGRQVELGPGQEHQIGQAEIGQRRHDVVRMGEVEHVGTEHDPEHDLNHDFGYRDEPPRPLGDDRREDCGQPDENQCGDGTFDHVSPPRLVTACCGTPRHLPGTRYAPRACIRVISEV